MGDERVGRRDLIVGAAGALASVLIGTEARACKIEGHQIPASEDLMEEHGILGRVLLIYDEVANRVEHHKPVAGQVLMNAATIITTTIQAHHENVEEAMVFPTLIKHNKCKDLIAILLKQHKVGRDVTKQMIARVQGGALKTEAGRADVASLCKMFVTMFRPHALREDTVVFPALRLALGGPGYNEFSAQLEEYEEKHFGQGELSNIVTGLDGLEIALGINDLNKFTAVLPKAMEGNALKTRPNERT